MNYDIFFHSDAWASLLTLLAMEMILGIDNIVFISILVGRLPRQLQERARKLGIFLALSFRVLLLFFLSHLSDFNEALFTFSGRGVSGRDLIMLVGGLFLLGKGTLELHNKFEETQDIQNRSPSLTQNRISFWGTVFQIMILDAVFSIDSVITAVGLVDDMMIMVIAIVISLVLMLVFSKMIGDFIEKHPTIKILALSFLLMIGLLLILEGIGIHVPKGYIYFAMTFSIFVEVLNIQWRKRTKKIREYKNLSQL